VIEAMKMENAIHASHNGVVKEIFVSEGDLVGTGEVMMAIN
jgi:pyruvate carboxylase subunit B